MPSSHPDSSDSLPPSGTSGIPQRVPSEGGGRSGSHGGEAAAPLAWRANLALFLATLASVFVTGVALDPAHWSSREALTHGAQFTGALMAILVAHELGHFVAARIHKVDATLPFFIPMPMLSPFGTMGAVIRMRGTISTRKALLDIGAAGPLAGLALAIPMYLWGVAHSTYVAPIEELGANQVELGASLLIRLLDLVAAPSAPAGMELTYSPVAFAAWSGMFVTMINLIPVAQLDAGHVAYALLGPRQNRIGQIVHRAMLVFFFVSLAGFLVRDARAGLGLVRIGKHVWNSSFWLVWFEVLAILGALAHGSRGREGHTEERPASPLGVGPRLVATLGLSFLASIGRGQTSPILWIAWFGGLAVLLVMEARWGVLKPNTMLDHPPTGPEPLRWGRKVVAVITLVFFALLFMPTPLGM